MPKASVVSTVRIVNLLKQAKDQFEQLKNKDLIALFGDTGAGKSTTTNYFIGIPLKAS